MQKIMKFAKTIATLGVVALTLQGCATGYLGTITTGTKRTIEHDNIRYMVSYVLPNGQIDYKRLLILGDKYTYELSDYYYGGINIKNLNKLGDVLDLKYLKPEPIRFELDGKIQINSYTANFKFDYDKQGKAITQAEKQVLDRYCFNKTDTAYLSCTMKFDMSMHQKFTPNQNLVPIKGNYPIEMTKASDNTALRAVLKPFAIVTDIVTAPIQLAVGALFLGSMTIGCNQGNCGQ